MKKLIALLSLCIFLTNSFAEEPNRMSRDEYKQIVNRLEALEAEQELNIFKFHSTLINYFESYKSDNSTQNHVEKLQTNRLKYIFGTTATPYSNLTFNSQIGIAKYYNLMEAQKSAPNTDPRPMGNKVQTSNKFDSLFFVKTAYFDYYAQSYPNLVFSIGRLPTLDGPPSHLLDGRERMGTYPLLGFGTEVDGIALTYKLGNALKLGQSLNLRAVYTPTQQLNYGTPDSYYPYNHPTYSGGAIGKPKSDSYALMIDYENKNLPFTRELEVIAQYTSIKDLHYFDESAKNSLSGLYGLDKNLAAYSDLTNGRFTNNLTYGFDYYTLSMTAEKLFKTNFDLHLSYVMTKTYARGAITMQPSGTIFTYYNNKDGDSKEGHTFLLLGRYQFNWAKLNNPYLGAELIYGSKYGQFFNGGTEDYSFFYGNQGFGEHLFMTLPILPTFTLRGGFRHQEIEWSRAIGYVKIDRQYINTLYLNLRVDI